MKTVNEYLEHYSRVSPTNTAVIDSATNERITYQALRDHVEALGSRLYGVVASHDLVVVISGSRRYLVEFVLACSRIGVRCLPVVEPTALGPTLAAVRLQQRPIVFYTNREDHRFSQNSETWIHGTTVKALKPRQIRFRPGADSPLYVNSTGGTTGLPKLVVATHRQVLANTRAVVQRFGFRNHDVHLSSYQFHAHEWFSRGICTGGSSILIQDGLNWPAVMREMEEYRPTSVMIGPHVVQYLLTQQWQLPASVNQVESGGSRLDPDTMSRFQRAFGVGLTAVWGSTETSGVALATPPSPTSSSSYLAPIGDYRVFVRGSGDIGEMIISSPAVADSYLGGNREHTGLEPGLFHTGDLVRTGDRGSMQIIGRLNNQFQRWWFNLNCEQIEAVFDRQPQIKSSMVIPLPATGGYRSAVLVEFAFDESAWIGDLSRLKRRVESGLENPLVSLPGNWYIVDCLPRKSSGKLDRQAGHAVIEEGRYRTEHHFSPGGGSYVRFFLANAVNRRFIGQAFAILLATAVLSLKNSRRHRQLPGQRRQA